MINTGALFFPFAQDEVARFLIPVLSFQIDWHNFVVVETVDYQQWEVGNFPPPTNPGEVGARVLMQRRVEANPPPPAASAGKSKDGEGEFF